MACKDIPPKSEQRKIGLCHVCKEDGLSIGFCTICCHWFCNACNKRWFARGIEAVLELVNGAAPGCCGPTATATSNTQQQEVATA